MKDFYEQYYFYVAVKWAIKYFKDEDRIQVIDDIPWL